MVAHVDSEERISNHHLHFFPCYLPDGIVSIQPELSYPIGPCLSSKTSRFVQQFKNVNQTTDVLCDETHGVDCTRNVLAIQGPPGVTRPLPGVVVTILRSGGSVDIHDDMYSMFSCPIEASKQVCPSTRDIRVWRRRVCRVLRRHGYRPIPERYPSKRCMSQCHLRVSDTRTHLT